MKPKESILWTIVVILAAAAICSFYFVDKFKIANGQFHRDDTHTYSERICSGSDSSKVCTNYFFTEQQHDLNKKLDLVYKILIVLALIIFSLDKMINPAPEDKMREQARMDPINTAQTAWKGLMEENEKERKDPAHGWTSSGKRTFLYISLLVICFAILGAFIESSHILEKLLKIN